MNRKLFAVVGAVALAIMLFSSSATAGAPKVDVTNAKVACDSAFGAVSFSPPMKTSDPAGTYKVKIKATFSNCFVSAVVSPVTILTGQLSGSYTTTMNLCSGGPLGFSPGAKTTVAWKADPTTPITPTKTTVNADSVIPNGVLTNTWNGQYPAYSLHAYTTTGAFAGPFIGLPQIRWYANEDANGIQTLCNTTGLKTLHLGQSLLVLPSS